MPKLLPATYPLTLDQVQQWLGNFRNPQITADELLRELIAANKNLAALNLNRAVLYLQENEEAKVIAAAEDSLAFLSCYQLNFQTQQSLAKQLGIYYSYYRCDHKKAQAFFITFLRNIQQATIEEAQAFMYMAYANSLQEDFHEDSHLQKACEIFAELDKNETLTPDDKNTILIEKAHTNFLLGLFHYRKSYLKAAEDKAACQVYLENAADFMRQAIDCQDQALTTIDDIDLKTQVLSELTYSYRLACVISYKMNDADKTAQALQKAQEFEMQAVAGLHQIQMTSFYLRNATIRDKYAVEFANIQTSARLQTGSTANNLGIYRNSMPAPAAVIQQLPSVANQRQLTGSSW